MSTWKAVLTEKGEALLAKMTQGSALEITHAEVGAGTVDASLLKQQTSVSTMKQRATIEPVGYPEEGMCALPVTITNEGLSAGYSAWQIGIFANDPDEGTVLFFIAQAEDIATGVPSPALMPSYKTQIIFHVEYGDADSVNVDVNPANVVSQAAMENYVNAKVGTAKDDIATHTANKENPHGVTAEQLNLAKVATSGSYNDLSNKPTIPTVPASLPANGGNADTVDGKHATDFAPSSHATNKNNPHGVTAEQVGTVTTGDIPTLHIWKKYSGDPTGYSMAEARSVTVGLKVSTAVSLSYSDEITISDGKVKLVNGTGTSFGTAATADILHGKFVASDTLATSIYYVSPTATFDIASNGLYISSAQKVTANSSAPLGYVAAKTKDAYSTDGQHTDGYWYEYVKQLGDPGYTYGTTDLTAGVSPLETGKLYFVYE